MTLRCFSILWLVLLSTGLVSPARSEEPQPEPSRLSVQRIFGKPEFEPEAVSLKWLPKGSEYTQLEASAETKDARDIVRYDALTGRKDVLVPAAMLVPAGQSKPLAIEDFRFSDDLSQVLIFTNSKRVWRHNTRGDFWLLDRSSRELRKLGGDAAASSLMFAKLNPVDRQAAWVKDRNIYLEDLRSVAPRVLTQTANADVINGTFDWVYEEELDLRDGFQWSPDGQFIAFWQMDTSGMRRFPLVNTQAGLYPEVQLIPWPKVGERNPAGRLGIVRVSDGETRWVNVPGDNRDNYIARIHWRPQSSDLLIEQLNRRQNVNRVFVTSFVSAECRELFVEKDDAWVDLHDELFWTPDVKQLTWISDRDGWRQVFLVSSDGSMRKVTDGKYDVIKLLAIVPASAVEGAPSDSAYFIASPDNATQSTLYRIGLDGSGLTRVTPANQSGTHAYVVSADGRAAIHTVSSFDQPPVTELVSLPDHKVLKSLADNKSLVEKLGKLAKQSVEFFRVDIGDGVLLDGWCLKPPGFDASKKYPLLVHVYGEPAGQTVLDRWGGGRMLWHQMLAQKGCIVMSFDNRGTPAPRGREWRKSVYHRVGVLGPDDQAAALKAVLKDRPYLDAGRVGIWGWSGGGSSSLHAIFRFPELYRTAISIAPVANQRYYDSIYQERYMGLPGDNVEGFTNGSPITWAKQLKGNLLLIHGTGDDNCHYATTELLIDELIKHGKQFELMAYPNRSHAIREGQNTVPHMFDLMTGYLERTLLKSP